MIGRLRADVGKDTLKSNASNLKKIVRKVVHIVTSSLRA